MATTCCICGGDATGHEVDAGLLVGPQVVVIRADGFVEDIVFIKRH